MIYLAYILLGFAALQFLVALSNFVFNPILKKNYAPNNFSVSILIPARNEENNIGNLLEDLTKIHYPNIEIFICNDQSNDRTVQIVEEYIPKHQNITLIHAPQLPTGWLGKNHACYLLSQKARGDYFLFLDADVRVKEGLLESLMEHSLKHNIQLISVFPQQIMLSLAEKIVVPIMNYILLSLLPLFLVRRSKKFVSLSAANGQCMFFDARCYRQTEPHRNLKHQMVEDIAIARYLKKQKYNIDCLTGNETIKCRMYSSYNEAINGFSKNVAAFFGGSLFIAVIYWLSLICGLFISLIFLPYKLTIGYICMVITKIVLVSIISRQNILHNFVYHIPRMVALGAIIKTAIINYFNKQTQWKGRYIN